ncbi:MAG: RidA family protein [Lachnospiraceae bacterium]|nr:RidA family protein [Lachnospiraceae bacterium]
MRRDTIAAENAPAAVGPYVHAVKVGDFVFTSGQLGLDPVTGTLPEGVEAQADQAIRNIQAVLAAADLTLADVIKTTVFLADMNDFAAINAIYAKYFTGETPARSCVQAAALPKGGLFEIEVIAVKQN